MGCGSRCAGFLGGLGTMFPVAATGNALSATTSRRCNLLGGGRPSITSSQSACDSESEPTRASGLESTLGEYSDILRRRPRAPCARGSAGCTVLEERAERSRKKPKPQREATPHPHVTCYMYEVAGADTRAPDIHSWIFDIQHSTALRHRSDTRSLTHRGPTCTHPIRLNIRGTHGNRTCGRSLANKQYS